jgi:hypothetical protein
MRQFRSRPGYGDASAEGAGAIPAYYRPCFIIFSSGSVQHSATFDYNVLGEPIPFRINIEFGMLDYLPALLRLSYSGVVRGLLREIPVHPQSMN